MGGGGGEQTGSSSPVLYNWQQLLPPWTQAGQQVALPWLLSRAFGPGMTPLEEKTNWKSMVGEIDRAASTARTGLAGRWVGGGASLNSPAYNAARSAIDIDRMSQVRKAAADFTKIKQGAKDTAVKNLLTGLYTAPPATTGQVSQQSTSSGGIK